MNVQKFTRLTFYLAYTVHILSCLWVWFGKRSYDGIPGWIENKAGLLTDNSNFTVYTAAVYWVLSTFSTVGYGDFTGRNNIEYIY